MKNREDIPKSWGAALLKLAQSGYSVVVDGDNIRVKRCGESSREDVESFINYLRSHKVELMQSTSFLIDATVSEVERVWIPEALEWMKCNDPEAWNRMLDLDSQISETAKAKNIERLKGLLTDYRVLMTGTAEHCKEALMEPKKKQLEFKILSSSEGDN